MDELITHEEQCLRAQFRRDFRMRLEAAIYEVEAERKRVMLKRMAENKAEHDRLWAIGCRRVEAERRRREFKVIEGGERV